MAGQPTDALACIGGKLMKMMYAAEGFVSPPLSDEGKLTERRDDTLCTTRMHSCADNLAVGAFLSEDSLSPRDVARFVKTTVACAYYRGGFYLALAVASGVIGPMVGIAALGDFALKNRRSPPLKAYMRISDSELSKIEGILGYTFEKKSVLIESLVHGSAPGAVKAKFTYKRLEFLGDAVLDFLAALYFLGRSQQMGELVLLKKISHSTSNAALGTLCIELTFHTHLRHRGLEQNIAQGEQAILSVKPRNITGCSYQSQRSVSQTSSSLHLERFSWIRAST
ncbi:hypothetical protein BGX26_004230 [Mortierella sp. AD094]|nr:hypothetical protein BGX26_004230 [Mortierella sp. AD094]